MNTCFFWGNEKNDLPTIRLSKITFRPLRTQSSISSIPRFILSLRNRHFDVKRLDRGAFQFKDRLENLHGTMTQRDENRIIPPYFARISCDFPITVHSRIDHVHHQEQDRYS